LSEVCGRTEEQLPLLLFLKKIAVKVSIKKSFFEKSNILQEISLTIFGKSGIFIEIYCAFWYNSIKQQRRNFVNFFIFLFLFA